METHHRKIDLQSPSDLTYLLSNIRAAAQEKLDLAIPPSAAPKGEEDAYRTKVEELLQEYITSTLSLALPSLSLNGLDASPFLLSPQKPETSTNDTINDTETGNYESYDPRLAEKLRNLYAQFENESTRVAELRRDAPGAAARQYVEMLENEMKDVEEAVEEEDERIDLGRLERKEEVERMWVRGTEGLVGLEGLTGTVARLERAGRAVDVVGVEA